MKALFLIALATVAGGCGPDLPPFGLYLGWMMDGDGRSQPCVLDLVASGPDRVHLTLDYGAFTCAGGEAFFADCDGDGAFFRDLVLVPDGGGQVWFDGEVLRGSFQSVLGTIHRFTVERGLGARSALSGSPGPGQRPGLGGLCR